MNNKCRPGLFKTLFLLPLLVVNAEGAAAEDESSENLPVEIIISGDDNVFRLEKLVFEAKKEVYELFSKLNDEEDYDIVCRRVYPTGSRISSTQCRPRFISELLLDAGQAELPNPYELQEQGLQALPANGSLRNGVRGLNPYIIEKHQKRLQEIMLRLTRENPALAKAVRRHTELATKLQEIKEE